MIFPVSWLRADIAGISAGLEHPIVSHSLQFDVLWVFVIVSIYYKTTTTKNFFDEGQELIAYGYKSKYLEYIRDCIGLGHRQ